MVIVDVALSDVNWVMAQESLSAMYASVRGLKFMHKA